MSILDSEELDGDIKEQIGVVFDGSNYPEKILLVEDDAPLNKTLTYNLISEGTIPYQP